MCVRSSSMQWVCRNGPSNLVRNADALSADHAKHRHDALYDLKVLVVGMPNVGKSSLLNALRRVGVRKGKAFRIGAEPGITRRLTGTVKIHEEPPVYVYDTPGVMVSYLGKGDRGAERGLKLALTGEFDVAGCGEYGLMKS